MTDWLLALVPTYGLWLLATVTFLACLALPVPCSILTLAAGGFVATEDLVLWQVVGAALAGGVLGDQLGYRIGRIGGHALLTRLSAHPTRGKLIARATDLMNRRGALGIFVTRWLLPPVSPWATYAAGATGLPWLYFTLGATAGEVVWVCLYVLVGYSFAGNIEAASDFATSFLGILAGVAAMAGFGYWLIASRRQDSQPEPPKDPV
jgi:membrane protein DedA with SNARE-associated domain